MLPKHVRNSFVPHRDDSIVQYFWIRHAEASAVDKNDPGLSETGVKQCRSLADRLTPVMPFDVVVVSPLRRAMETAKLAVVSTMIITTKLCREQRTNPCDWMQGELASGEETSDQLQIRAEAFLMWLSSIAIPPLVQTIAIVSHSDFIRMITGIDLDHTDILVSTL